MHVCVRVFVAQLINCPSQVHVAETIYTCDCPCPSYSAKHCPNLSDTLTHTHLHTCENIQSSQPASQLINCSLLHSYPFHQPTDRPIYIAPRPVYYTPHHHSVPINQSFAPDTRIQLNTTPHHTCPCASQSQDHTPQPPID